MKLNQLFSWTALVFLFALPFLIGCGEGREMHFPDLDLPDSVTVTIEVPAGAAFDLAVSGDFREEVDFRGVGSIVHNKEQKYSFTKNFSQTFSLIDSSEVFPLVDPDERFFSVMLKCTALESESAEDTGSLRLIIKFNRDGNSEEGNYDETYFPGNKPPVDELKRDFGNDPQDWPEYFKLGTLINFQTVFSRYDGIRPGLQTTLPNDNQ
ncbi:hypothetical protein C6501_07710 [Candidatus Poribacteria bacterium]|nr:MAG: hypothetical protein C6501_07710 [Candidatus Poribacteria bacterium]